MIEVAVLVIGACCRRLRIGAASASSPVMGAQHTFWSRAALTSQLNRV